MPNGTVKFFNVQKGFGFITPDDGSKDVFVPVTSIAASGLTALKPGLRVAFETQPDGKGPKAVELRQIAVAPSTQAERQKPRPVETHTSKSTLTVYLDPASDAAGDAVAELRDAGFEPQLVDYIANPPTADELKALSLLLRNSDQSLVRQFDPLFSELQLDDRFISDSEFWTAIHEHPSLINGPVLATATKARVCRTEIDVEAFVGVITPGGTAAVSKPKALPASLVRLLMGDKAPPVTAIQESAGEKPAAALTPRELRAVSRREDEVEINAKGEAAPATKTTAATKSIPKIKTKPKRKAVAKLTKATKEIVKKTVKKAGRPRK